jgi:protein SCO1/2
MSGGSAARSAFCGETRAPVRRLERGRAVRACVICWFGLVATLAHAQDHASIRFEQRIGERLALDAVLTDTRGTRHALREYFGHRPVLLYFGYARCPQLCSVVADGTNQVLRRLTPTVGREFEVIAVSIDPTEPPAAARDAEALQVRSYGRTGAAAGWHYLTGDAPAIKALADSAGFRFRYDPVSRQFAHAAGFLVATPEGVISRYFLGVDFPADEVASALGRAAAGRTGPSVYDLVLLCFRGGGVSGRYTALIWRVLGAAIVVTVVTLAGGIGWMLHQERRQHSSLSARPARLDP